MVNSQLLTFDPPFPADFKWLLTAFVSCAAAVVTKARDTIEPVLMTQIVTKAKEIGKSRATK